MKVCELVGGDVIELVGTSATFVGRSRHPLHQGLELVVWIRDDGLWSLDALHPLQEVGDLTTKRLENVPRLKAAIDGSTGALKRGP